MAKSRASTQAAAPVAPPQRADAVRVVAPKVSDPQESWLRPDSPGSPPFHPPATADPAVSGPVKDSSSSDPPGAPTVKAELAQDAALVTERDSAVSAARRPAVPQPVSESGKPTERPIVSYAPEIEQSRKRPPRTCPSLLCLGFAFS